MIIFIGPSGAGKTTLIQALYGEDLRYRKTQTIEVHSAIIDTPGEFLEQKNLNRSLLVSSYDADLVVFLEPADSEQFFFPPGFRAMFAVPVVGVITKCDLTEDLSSARFRLEYAGVDEIFPVSAVSGEGCETLAHFLQTYGLKAE